MKPYEFSNTAYKSLLPKRSDNSHKGVFGTLGAVVGSRCYQGAATLSVKSALYSGVGIVCAFIPEDIYIPFASKINGAVIEPLSSTDGKINDLSLITKVRSRNCTAILCGSGLGISRSTARTLSSVMMSKLPVVIDGDGITMLAEDLSLLDRNEPTVLTPHISEFSRLCKLKVSEILQNRLEIVADFAKTHNCIVVLKDSVTVIASPDRLLTLSNPTSALSKGGSGDVLAGILSSFLAQGISPLDAAVSAVSLHNACGHSAKEKYGEYSAQPDDFICELRKLLKV